MAKRLRGKKLAEAASCIRRHFRGEEDEDGSESGGFVKIRHTKPRDPEKTKAKAKGRKPALGLSQVPPVPVRTQVVRPAFQRRDKMPQRSTQQPQREFSGFGRALYLARQIEDRHEDTSELSEVVSSLEDRDKRNLVFRVQREVLIEGRVRLPALFAVCKAARVAGNGKNMLGVAHASAAVYKAMHEGGMTLEDMLTVGLATVNVFRTKKGKTVSRTEPRISHETLQQATRQLRKRGKRGAAEILENYLLGIERRRAEAQARRAATAEASEAKAETTEAEAEANETEVTVTEAEVTEAEVTEA